MNLHNHTILSDGSFTAEMIVNLALHNKLDVIGITDHYYKSSFKPCIIPDDIDNYFQSIHNVREKVKEKNRQIVVLTGAEIDYPAVIDELDELLPYIENLDYILFEYVNETNITPLLEIRPSIPIPIGLAHSNLIEDFKDTNDKDLMDLFIDNDIFIELASTIRNSVSQIDGETGEVTFQLYYNLREEFFILAKDTKLKLSVGSDTHTNLEDVINIDKAYEFLRKHNLMKNLVDIKHNEWMSEVVDELMSE